MAAIDWPADAYKSAFLPTPAGVRTTGSQTFKMTNGTDRRWYEVENAYGLVKSGSTFNRVKLYSRVSQKTISNVIQPQERTKYFAFKNDSWYQYNTGTYYRVLQISDYNTTLAYMEKGRAATPTPGGSGVILDPSITSSPEGQAAVANTYMPALSGDRLESQLRVLRTQMQTATDAFMRSFDIAVIGSRSPDSLEARIDQALKAELLKKGFTVAQIAWFQTGGRANPFTGAIAGVTNVPISSGGSGSSSGGGSGSLNPDNLIPTPTPVTTNVVVKAPFGYLSPSTADIDSRPQIYQTFPLTPKYGQVIPDNINQAQTEVFYFPYIPNNVQYSGLGSTWTEIPRTGDLPMVEFSNYNLMKISFEFLIASDKVEPGGAVVPDGLYVSVEDELNKLRRMAQRPYPVSIIGMDSILRLALRRASATGKALEFVIGDLQFSAIRRTQRAGDSLITAASVKMTLQEMPIEEKNVARFRLPVIPPKKPPKPPRGGGGQTVDLNAVSSLLSGLAGNGTLVITPPAQRPPCPNGLGVC